MTAMTGPADLLLPEGTRLIHIGPPKTGTTYIQGAFHGNREAVSAQGVHYAGATRQPIEAVLAGLGRPSRRTGNVASRSTWQTLVDEIRGAGDRRVLLSSERFSDAHLSAIRSVVEDLGADRVHIAVTLRPLARILPSLWQQKVQARLPISYEDFLEQIFSDPDSDRAKSLFWYAQRHDQLIARWAEIVGLQNMTVIALDERDHDFVLRAFEQLLGLRDGTLVAGDRTNRSMTMAEIEIVRSFNEQFFAEGLSRQLHVMVMHIGLQTNLGAVAYIKSRDPGPDEPRIETPQWALDRAGEIADEMVDAITASGVRIVGDPEHLRPVLTSRLVDGRQPDPRITPDVAATVAMSVLRASGLVPDPVDADGHVTRALDRTDRPGPDPDPPDGGHRVATDRRRGRTAHTTPARAIPMTSMTGPADLLLPEGTRLIHIGPPKTGTTYLQGAFHRNREAVSAQGVHYAGATRQPIAAIQAVMGKSSPNTGETPSMKQWRSLVNEVAHAPQSRVVVSSEFLAEAKPAMIKTIIEELGGDRAHVVVTLRPLARILPSQWQQFVQSGQRMPFNDWLDAVFNDPSRITPTFWRRHRHDRLVARWAEVVGPQNVTAIALDERDHGMVLRVFEQLVGLRAGTLIAEEDLSNRSMTLSEVEVVRAFNEQFFSEGLSRPLHTKVMRFGAAAT